MSKERELRPLTEEEIKKYIEVASSILDAIGSTPADVFRSYIKYGRPIVAGSRDKEFLTQMTIEQLTTLKRNTRLFSDVAEKFLEIGPMIEKYLIQSGQLVKKEGVIIDAANQDAPGAIQ